MDESELSGWVTARQLAEAVGRNPQVVRRSAERGRFGAMARHLELLDARRWLFHPSLLDPAVYRQYVGGPGNPNFGRRPDHTEAAPPEPPAE